MHQLTPRNFWWSRLKICYNGYKWLKVIWNFSTWYFGLNFFYVILYMLVYQKYFCFPFFTFCKIFCFHYIFYDKSQKKQPPKPKTKTKTKMRALQRWKIITQGEFFNYYLKEQTKNITKVYGKICIFLFFCYGKNSLFWIPFIQRKNHKMEPKQHMFCTLT